jgi:peptidyl-prolyl cis-trans isomerase A (cyclophilin A)
MLHRALPLLLAVACSGGAPAPESKPVEKPATPPPAPAPAPAPPPAPKFEAIPLPEGANPALLDPTKATEKAPDTYTVVFTTTKGEFEIKVQRDWAPIGADRFYNLVKIGYYDDAAFFRVVDGFMVQFGISSYGAVNEKWREAKIQDDPNKQPNTRGRISFATSGPNSRTGQVFINFVDNKNLDGMGFSPFGEVTKGMEIVDSLFKGYGEGAPRGKGPSQPLMQKFGKAYLQKDFPQLDYVKTAKIK